jgi:hypothetical protein
MGTKTFKYLIANISYDFAPVRLSERSSVRAGFILNGIKKKQRIKVIIWQTSHT